MLEAWPEIARAIGLAGAQVMAATVDLWGSARARSRSPDAPQHAS
jgi:hypothetical protein